MSPLPTKICVACQKKFVPSIPKQRYCVRSCFAKSWYLKVRDKKRKMPMFRCPNCNALHQLEFKPKAVKFAWMNYSCPTCGYRPLG